VVDENPSVAVVCGGGSSEAEVSRGSGREVAAALRHRFERVSEVELDHGVGRALREVEADVVFPVLHGPPGEDGTFQGWLEVAGYPYVGSGVASSACAMDKVVAKLLFRAAGIPVAADAVVDRREGIETAAERVVARIGQRVVVKPRSQGSALGIRFADGSRELAAALKEALAHDERVFVERRVEGREVTVGVLEREEPMAFPVIEITTPEDSWYDYEHRYTPGMSEHLVPARIGDQVSDELQRLALSAHRALGCRDLSRADFLVPGSGEAVLLEVNTLPGMTSTSLFPDGARAAGIEFPDLVAHLVERALARGA
jgi:D-alanine-D-alanine ligase